MSLVIYPTVGKEELILLLEQHGISSSNSCQSAMAHNQLLAFKKSNLYDYHTYYDLNDLIYDINDQAFIFLFEYFLSATNEVDGFEATSTETAFLHRFCKNSNLLEKIIQNNFFAFIKWIIKIMHNGNCDFELLKLDGEKQKQLLKNILLLIKPIQFENN